jgi:hypothetical protein
LFKDKEQPQPVQNKPVAATASDSGPQKTGTDDSKAEGGK